MPLRAGRAQHSPMKASARSSRGPCHAAPPACRLRDVRVLNFYSSVFADQLRRGRKTATIRLGDKSHKYRKNDCVLVTIGYQHSPREKIFNAVIDQVEVKRVHELSPRDIEHDNPEFRRVDEMVHFLEQIYGRKVSMEDTVTVVRFSQIIENPPEMRTASTVSAAPTTSGGGSPHIRVGLPHIRVLRFLPAVLAAYEFRYLIAHLAALGTAFHGGGSGSPTLWATALVAVGAGSFLRGERTWSRVAFAAPNLVAASLPARGCCARLWLQDCLRRPACSTSCRQLGTRSHL